MLPSENQKLVERVISAGDSEGSASELDRRRFCGRRVDSANEAMATLNLRLVAARQGVRRNQLVVFDNSHARATASEDEGGADRNSLAPITKEAPTASSSSSSTQPSPSSTTPACAADQLSSLNSPSTHLRLRSRQKCSRHLGEDAPRGPSPYNRAVGWRRDTTLRPCQREREPVATHTRDMDEDE